MDNICKYPYVHGLFFMVDCVWLCCLTYVIVWMSRIKASFKYWSILITNLGKQSSFSPSVFFFMRLCCCIGDFSFHAYMPMHMVIYIYISWYIYIQEALLVMGRHRNNITFTYIVTFLLLNRHIDSKINNKKNESTKEVKEITDIEWSRNSSLSASN